MLAYVVCLVLSAASSAHALGLPEGVKACKLDASVNECAKRNGQDAIKFLVKGNPKYGIPVLDPVFIEKLQVAESSNRNAQLNMTLTNLSVYGLKDSRIVKSQIDIKRKKVVWTLHTPRLKLDSGYKVSGKILLLTINSTGNQTIELEDFNFAYAFDYKLVDRKNVEYLEIKGEPKVTYKIAKAKLNFENLISQNEALSKATNQMINDNWEVLNDALGPTIAEGISGVFTHLLKSLSKRVPYNQIFLK